MTRNLMALAMSALLLACGGEPEDDGDRAIASAGEGAICDKGSCPSGCCDGDMCMRLSPDRVRDEDGACVARSAAGCFSEGEFIEAAFQSYLLCGKDGQPCQACLDDAACIDGACVSTHSGCFVGDRFVGRDKQTRDECGTGGAPCMQCVYSDCLDGICQ